MTLYEIKQLLPSLPFVAFQLENGSHVPDHFHVTEVGQINKKFIDCGGKMREEQYVQFQLWSSHDIDHRLLPHKLLSIIELSEKKLGLANSDIEVEYQGDTIGRYELDFNGSHFILKNKATACLAEDQCGIVPAKKNLKLADLTPQNCTPGSDCC
jgi:hypothetical protein